MAGAHGRLRKRAAVVEGCDANLPAEVAFTEAPTEIELGLYDPSDKLLGAITVTKNGKYTFKLKASDAVAGVYTIKVVGAAKGGATIDCVKEPENLWAPAAIINGNTVAVAFAAEVSFNEAKKAAKIGNASGVC